jgi:predicted DNA-binding transcriptional regulator AlpA
MDDPLDPILRKRAILADLGIDNSTLSAWIRRGDFPLPLVLNPGQKREIVGWPTSTYLQWKADRPQRVATPITDKAYSAPAIAKRQRTRAAKRAAKREGNSGSVPAPAATAPALPVKRLRSLPGSRGDD